MYVYVCFFVENTEPLQKSTVYYLLSNEIELFIINISINLFYQFFWLELFAVHFGIASCVSDTQNLLSTKYL